jgi:hypothetical protein
VEAAREYSAANPHDVMFLWCVFMLEGGGGTPPLEFSRYAAF